jgi:hypothetical protein
VDEGLTFHRKFSEKTNRGGLIGSTDGITTQFAVRCFGISVSVRRWIGNWRWRHLLLEVALNQPLAKNDTARWILPLVLSAAQRGSNTVKNRRLIEGRRGLELGHVVPAIHVKMETSRCVIRTGWCRRVEVNTREGVIAYTFPVILGHRSTH